MIVLAIKSFFFYGVDSYSLRRKLHTSRFFFLFCGEMIRVVCAMLVVAIKDLEVQIGNPNMLLGKSVIWFELLSQKLETGKQTTSALYYQ